MSNPAMVLELCSVLHDRKELLFWLRRGDEERSTQFVYLPLHKEWYANDPEAEALVAGPLNSIQRRFRGRVAGSDRSGSFARRLKWRDGISLELSLWRSA